MRLYLDANVIIYSIEGPLQRSERMRRKAGSWLWRSAKSPSLVVAVVSCLSDIPLLTAADRALAGDNRIRQLVTDLCNGQAESFSAAEKLSTIGPSAIPELMKALSAPNPPPTVVAIPEILASMGPDAVPALCEASRLPQDSVRWAAVKGLRNLGPKAKAAIPCLAAALRDKTSLSFLAVAALEDMGDVALPSLIEALEDPGLPDLAGSMNVRSHILKVLGGSGASAKPAIGAMVRQLGHSNDYVRYCAADALGRLGPLAVQALPQLRIATNDPEVAVRTTALKAINRISE